jgi:mannosyltransferase
MASVSRRAPPGSLAALAAVLAAGAAVRSWRLALPGLTSDEAFSWRLSTFAPGEIVRRTAEDVHSPLFYLVLKGWLAAAGASPFALRLLSVVLGLCAVAVVFALVREAGGGAGGATVAALLAALHPLQVQQARNARMYALGVLLAALTALLLLRALRAEARSWPWWCAYGVAAALFVYAHYYALFTLAAQALGGLALAGDRRARFVRGLAVAGGVGLALLAPWLPALLAQARRVKEEYWIPPVTGDTLLSALLRWATGLPGGPLAWLALLGWTLLTVWALRRVRGPALFFLCQALVPWLLALALSTVGGRPLFLERFTVFAQVGLFGLVGIAWPVLHRWGRLGTAAAIGAATLAGLFAFLRALPDTPPATVQVARYLRRQREPGDVVVVDSPRALNKLMFYGRQVDLAELPLRALPGVAGGGHYTHLASLQPDERVDDVEQAAQGRRIWRASERPHPVPPAPPGWTMGFARVFEGGEGSRYLLVRYDRGP